VAVAPTTSLDTSWTQEVEQQRETVWFLITFTNVKATAECQEEQVTKLS
jgi:hypothetical protein